jgi:hypothetical protein
MEFYFKKVFEDYTLNEVDYYKCTRCGFCASRTHFEMSEDEWNQVNHAFHAVSHYSEDNPYNRNQRYLYQAQMLSMMNTIGLIHQGNWLDWGSGIGAVSRLLDLFFGLRLMTYDRYFTPEINVIDSGRLLPRDFDLVMSTAVFEHVRSRETLDEIESYVKHSGVLAIHTLVPESVPCDPDWMYLLPVHCAFHTNKSMQILMQDWGYTCSVYNELAKMWIWFRSPVQAVQEKVELLNTKLGWEYLKFKNGFMDYWK